MLEAPSPTAVRTLIGSSSSRTSEEEPEGHGKAEQGEPRHGEAGHRAAAEGDGQRLGDPAPPGPFGGAGVGGGGDPHPDQPGRGGQDGAGHIGDRSPGASPVEEHEDQRRHGGHEHGDGHVLTPEERHGPLADDEHQLLHALVTRAGGEDQAGERRRQQQPGETGGDGDVHPQLGIQGAPVGGGKAGL